MLHQKKAPFAPPQSRHPTLSFSHEIFLLEQAYPVVYDISIYTYYKIYFYFMCKLCTTVYRDIYHDLRKTKTKKKEAATTTTKKTYSINVSIVTDLLLLVLLLSCIDMLNKEDTRKLSLRTKKRTKQHAQRRTKISTYYELNKTYASTI